VDKLTREQQLRAISLDLALKSVPPNTFSEEAIYEKAEEYIRWICQNTQPTK
jgi:hypothetical protein